MSYNDVCFCITNNKKKKKTCMKKQKFSVLYGRQDIINLKAETWSNTTKNVGKEVIKIFLNEFWETVTGDAHEWQYLNTRDPATEKAVVEITIKPPHEILIKVNKISISLRHNLQCLHHCRNLNYCHKSLAGNRDKQHEFWDWLKPSTVVTKPRNIIHIFMLIACLHHLSKLSTFLRP